MYPVLVLRMAEVLCVWSNSRNSWGLVVMSGWECGQCYISAHCVRVMKSAEAAPLAQQLERQRKTDTLGAQTTLGLWEKWCCINKNDCKYNRRRPGRWRWYVKFCFFILDLQLRLEANSRPNRFHLQSFSGSTQTPASSSLRWTRLVCVV